VCQTIPLTIGSRYNLSFDVTSLPLVQTAKAYAYLNNQLILTIINNNYTTVVRGYAVFTANVSSNKICFNGSASLWPNAVTVHNDYTPILDNFVL
jgi:hypothetical protein